MQNFTSTLVIFYAFGPISIAINGPILKNNTAIWSYCFGPSMACLETFSSALHIVSRYLDALWPQEIKKQKIPPPNSASFSAIINGPATIARKTLACTVQIVMEK